MSKGCFSLGEPVLLHEPAGGLILKEDEQEKDARQHLQRKWDAPLGRVGDIRDLPAHAIIHKVAEHDAGDIEKLHASNTAAADLSVCVLADVCGYHGTDEADAKTTHEAAYVELGEARRVDGRCCLYYGADDKDYISQDESPFSATRLW